MSTPNLTQLVLNSYSGVLAHKFSKQTRMQQEKTENAKIWC